MLLSSLSSIRVELSLRNCDLVSDFLEHIEDGNKEGESVVKVTKENFVSFLQIGQFFGPNFFVPDLRAI